MNAKKDQSFEKSIARLEEILEKMNSGSIALEESMKLYEEADVLISSCSKQLSDAEHKIESLIKKRGGELKLSDSNTPETEKFVLNE